ncbi:MAG TPA: filamentous hemagglutinin N-terminal domain-containing protein, partial [Chlamydiales bacterium]|nr:filamentous hemagglutinin N-terminal domain-containing protein [Chlamydiales bacterium]
MKKFFICGLIYSLFITANPTNPEIIHGDIEITQRSNAHLQVISKDKSIIHWDNFSIEENEITEFIQSENSSILNRVIGSSSSNIAGKLISNGTIYLVNPKGIYINDTAVIDVGAWIASTLDFSDNEFLNEQSINFLGESLAEITNLGTIKACDGDAFLIGYKVHNKGSIQAKDTAGIASGLDIYICPNKSEKILIKTSSLQEQLNTTGLLQEGTLSGQNIELKSDGSLYSIAINHKGHVDALSPSSENGRIFLKASNGRAEIYGSMKAQKSDNGGNIQILGDHLHLYSKANIDACGINGGGEILIGGDYQGKNLDIPNALTLFTEEKAVINASAEKSGNGGKVILWADEGNAFYGEIYAGGQKEGNGGFVEISTKTSDLVFDGFVNSTGNAENIGTLLLDPCDITISTSSSSPSFTNPYKPDTNIATLNRSDIQTALANNAVTIDASGSGAGTGTITVSSDISWNSGNRLTLTAPHMITIQANITSTGTATDPNNVILDLNALSIHVDSTSAASSVEIQILSGKIHARNSHSAGGYFVMNGTDLKSSTIYNSGGDFQIGYNNAFYTVNINSNTSIDLSQNLVIASENLDIGSLVFTKGATVNCNSATITSAHIDIEGGTTTDAYSYLSAGTSINISGANTDINIRGGSGSNAYASLKTTSDGSAPITINGSGTLNIQGGSNTNASASISTQNSAISIGETTPLGNITIAGGTASGSNAYIAKENPSTRTSSTVRILSTGNLLLTGKVGYAQILTTGPAAGVTDYDFLKIECNNCTLNTDATGTADASIWASENGFITLSATGNVLLQPAASAGNTYIRTNNHISINDATNVSLIANTNAYAKIFSDQRDISIGTSSNPISSLTLTGGTNGVGGTDASAQIYAPGGIATNNINIYCSGATTITGGNTLGASTAEARIYMSDGDINLSTGSLVIGPSNGTANNYISTQGSDVNIDMNLGDITLQATSSSHAFITTSGGTHLVPEHINITNAKNISLTSANNHYAKILITGAGDININKASEQGYGSLTLDASSASATTASCEAAIDTADGSIYCYMAGNSSFLAGTATDPYSADAGIFASGARTVFFDTHGDNVFINRSGSNEYTLTMTAGSGTGEAIAGILTNSGLTTGSIRGIQVINSGPINMTGGSSGTGVHHARIAAVGEADTSVTLKGGTFTGGAQASPSEENIVGIFSGRIGGEEDNVTVTNTGTLTLNGGAGVDSDALIIGVDHVTLLGSGTIILNKSANAKAAIYNTVSNQTITLGTSTTPLGGLTLNGCSVTSTGTLNGYVSGTIALTNLQSTASAITSVGAMTISNVGTLSLTSSTNTTSITSTGNLTISNANVISLQGGSSADAYASIYPNTSGAYSLTISNINTSLSLTGGSGTGTYAAIYTGYDGTSPITMNGEGTLSLTGGSNTNASAYISTQNSGISIGETTTFGNITILGGSASGTNAYIAQENPSTATNDPVRILSTGNLTMTGKVGYAQILSTGPQVGVTDYDFLKISCNNCTLNTDATGGGTADSSIYASANGFITLSATGNLSMTPAASAGNTYIRANNRITINDASAVTLIGNTNTYARIRSDNREIAIGTSTNPITSLTLTGGTNAVAGSDARAEIRTYGGTTTNFITIYCSGAMTITGGDTLGASSANAGIIMAEGDINLTTGSLILGPATGAAQSLIQTATEDITIESTQIAIEGGSSTDAYSQIVGGSITISEANTSISLTGGSASGAYAAIKTTIDGSSPITMNGSGTITLTGGSNTNASAYISTQNSAISIGETTAFGNISIIGGTGTSTNAYIAKENPSSVTNDTVRIISTGNLLLTGKVGYAQILTTGPAVGVTDLDFLKIACNNCTLNTNAAGTGTASIYASSNGFITLSATGNVLLQPAASAGSVYIQANNHISIDDATNVTLTGNTDSYAKIRSINRDISIGSSSNPISALTITGGTNAGGYAEIITNGGIATNIINIYSTSTTLTGGDVSGYARIYMDDGDINLSTSALNIGPATGAADNYISTQGSDINIDMNEGDIAIESTNSSFAYITTSGGSGSAESINITNVKDISLTSGNDHYAKIFNTGEGDININYYSGEQGYGSLTLDASAATATSADSSASIETANGSISCYMAGNSTFTAGSAATGQVAHAGIFAAGAPLTTVGANSGNIIFYNRGYSLSLTGGSGEGNAYAGIETNQGTGSGYNGIFAYIGTLNMTGATAAGAGNHRTWISCSGSGEVIISINGGTWTGASVTSSTNNNIVGIYGGALYGSSGDITLQNTGTLTMTAGSGLHGDVKIEAKDGVAITSGSLIVNGSSTADSKIINLVSSKTIALGTRTYPIQSLTLHGGHVESKGPLNAYVSGNIDIRGLNDHNAILQSTGNLTIQNANQIDVIGGADLTAQILSAASIDINAFTLFRVAASTSSGTDAYARIYSSSTSGSDHITIAGSGSFFLTSGTVATGVATAYVEIAKGDITFSVENIGMQARADDTYIKTNASDIIINLDSNDLILIAQEGNAYISSAGIIDINDNRDISLT